MPRLSISFLTFVSIYISFVLSQPVVNVTEASQDPFPSILQPTSDKPGHVFCPPGYFIRGINTISLGMNASMTQVSQAFKGLASTLRAPFVYGISTLSQANQNVEERNISLAFMLGGINVVLRKPSKQGIGLAPCVGSKLTAQAMNEYKIPNKMRRDWHWVHGLWYTSNLPGIYVCRDPSCKPLGTHEFLPERRIFSDQKIYTRREFLSTYAQATEEDFKRGTIVPHNVTEEIQHSSLPPPRLLKASNMGTLGPLLPREVVVDFDPKHPDANLLPLWVAQRSGGVTPRPVYVHSEGGVRTNTLATRPEDCFAYGCTFNFVYGAQLVFRPKEGMGKRAANMVAMVWHTPKLVDVVNFLARNNLLGPPLNGIYSQCVRISLKKYDILTHSGLYICDLKHNSGAGQTTQKISKDQLGFGDLS